MSQTIGDTKNIVTAKVYTEYDEEYFVWEVNSDGTGIIYDIAYEEKHEFEHTITENLIVKIELMSRDKLDEIYSDNDNAQKISAYKIEEDEEDENEEKSETQQEIIDELNDIFWGMINDKLENPVGGAPENEDSNIKIGTEEEFISALGCVYNLAVLNKDEFNCHKYDMAITFDGSGDGYEYSVPGKLCELIDCIIETFGYTSGVEYDYIDNNGGRITAYGSSGDFIELESCGEKGQPARKRLTKHNELREILEKYNPEAVSIIEKTFDFKYPDNNSDSNTLQDVSLVKNTP